MISSTPEIRTLIPLLPSGLEMEGDEIFKLTSKDGDIAVEKTSIGVAAPKEFVPDMIFEQEPSQLLNAILPLYLNGQVLRTPTRRRTPMSMPGISPWSWPEVMALPPSSGLRSTATVVNRSGLFCHCCFFRASLVHVAKACLIPIFFVTYAMLVMV